MRRWRIAKGRDSQLWKRVGALAGIVSRLLCLLGFHNFKVIDATIGFGLAGGTSTVQCRRCGRVVTRSSWTLL